MLLSFWTSPHLHRQQTPFLFPHSNVILFLAVLLNHIFSWKYVGNRAFISQWHLVSLVDRTTTNVKPTATATATTTNSHLTTNPTIQTTPLIRRNSKNKNKNPTSRFRHPLAPTRTSTWPCSVDTTQASRRLYRWRRMQLFTCLARLPGNGRRVVRRGRCLCAI